MHFMSFVLSYYYVSFDSSIFQVMDVIFNAKELVPVPSILDKGECCTASLLERFIVRISFNMHDTLC